MIAMTEDLQNKINGAIKLLRSVAKTNTDIELAYSGGKDSDVILKLAKMACIPFTPIYKNTTIDPPGTINHVRENNVKIVQPKRPFFKIIENKGFPSRFSRFCCEEIKEYKIKDTAIIGVRREESQKRAAIYKEPVRCRIYKNKDHVNQVLPILDWTLENVKEFITEFDVKLAPHYYREDGTVDFERRLGCMGCPLKSDCGLADFKAHPKMLRMWIKSGLVWWNTHPNISPRRRYDNIYEYFAYRVMFSGKTEAFVRNRNSLFPRDWKADLENYFNIELP